MYWKWHTPGSISIHLIISEVTLLQEIILSVPRSYFPFEIISCYIFGHHKYKYPYPVPFLLFFQCSAYSASASSEKTWTMRTTFPEYVVALATIVGSVLFSVCSFLQTFNPLFNVLSYSCYTYLKCRYNFKCGILPLLELY